MKHNEQNINDVVQLLNNCAPKINRFEVMQLYLKISEKYQRDNRIKGVGNKEYWQVIRKSHEEGLAAMLKYVGTVGDTNND